MQRGLILVEDTVTLEKPDGRQFPDIRASVQPDRILIPDTTIHLEEGDLITRRLPSGIVELFKVFSPHFYNESGLEPHFRAKIERVQAKSPLAQRGEGDRKVISVFFSHSHQDVELVKLLIDLLRSALNLPSSQIRATSVDGFRLPGGSNTTEQLRIEVQDARILVGVISQTSLKSAYVTFELGARWGSGKPMVPLLAPEVGPDSLAGPLQGINALSCRSSAQLHQFVEEISGHLNLELDRPAAYQKCVDDIIAYSNQPVVSSINRTSLSKSTPPHQPLSKEARELLLAAADDETGVVMRVRTAGGLNIQTKGKNFVTDREPRTEARWQGALTELINSNLVEDRNGKGEVFWLTKLGYDEADSLASEAPNHADRADG